MIARTLPRKHQEPERQNVSRLRRHDHQHQRRGNRPVASPVNRQQRCQHHDKREVTVKKRDVSASREHQHRRNRDRDIQPDRFADRRRNDTANGQHHQNRKCKVRHLTDSQRHHRERRVNHQNGRQEERNLACDRIRLRIRFAVRTDAIDQRASRKVDAVVKVAHALAGFVKRPRRLILPHRSISRCRNAKCEQDDRDQQDAAMAGDETWWHESGCDKQKTGRDECRICPLRSAANSGSGLA